jgi:hypothetical protein
MGERKENGMTDLTERIWKHKFVVALVGMLPEVAEDCAIECALTQVDAAWDLDEERGTPLEAARATYDAMADAV